MLFCIFFHAASIMSVKQRLGQPHARAGAANSAPSTTAAQGSSTQLSSSPTTSTAASFVEGLVYSQRAGKGKQQPQPLLFGSLARRTQELGAELCGRLSQAVLLALPISSSSSSSTTFMTDVQRDVSAHYGSHAVRRGRSKPFGPCVHPIPRRGNLTLSRGGLHGPLYMRLWSVRRTRRCWCARCGVWLTRGSGGKAAAQGDHAVLATVKECRLRDPQQQQQRRQRRTHRRRLAKREASGRGKFTACCIRCLDKAHKAAARAAVSLVRNTDAAAAANTAKTSTEKAPKRSQTAQGAKPRVGLRQQRMAATEKALTAVVAAARVPKRNRRQRRRSARRPRKTKKASVKAGQTLKTTNASAATAAATSASTTAHLRSVLAANLSSKKKAAGATAAGGASAEKTAVPAKPPVVRAAQKSLQGLVPTGPLKKQKAAPAGTPREKREEAVPFLAHTPPSLPSPSPPPPAATPRSSAPTPPQQSHLQTTAAVQGGEQRLVKTDTTAPRTAVAVATVSVAHASEKPAVSSSALGKPKQPSPSSGGLSTAVTAPAAAPVPPPPPSPRQGVARVASPPPPTVRPPLPLPPKGAPVKAKAPVKAQAKGTGKAKLMDAMSKLGF